MYWKITTESEDGNYAITVTVSNREGDKSEQCKKLQVC